MLEFLFGAITGVCTTLGCIWSFSERRPKYGLYTGEKIPPLGKGLAYRDIGDRYPSINESKGRLN